MNPEKYDLPRGRAAWWMSVEDVLLGHALGFDYVMSGDHRNTVGGPE